jgi:MFS family permease
MVPDLHLPLLVVARISDVTSRPTAYSWSIAFYIIGYAIVAGSSSVAHVAAGTLFIKLGQTGLNFLNAIMIADLTPLEWRGFWTGFLSTPYSSFRFLRFSVGVESPTDVRFVLVCPRSHQRFVQPSLASSRRCVH